MEMTKDLKDQNSRKGPVTMEGASSVDFNNTLITQRVGYNG
jgi:hypothetical protein